jgi:hypothetical protein
MKDLKQAMNIAYLISVKKLDLDVSERAFRKIYTPALLHKSNYFWVKKTELKSLNVRADLLEQID